jgi:hypothetical protein
MHALSLTLSISHSRTLSLSHSLTLSLSHSLTLSLSHSLTLSLSKSLTFSLSHSLNLSLSVSTFSCPFLTISAFVFNLSQLIARKKLFSETCYLMKTEITTKEKFDSGLVVSTAFNCQIACQNSNPCQVNIYITKIYSVK